MQSRTLLKTGIVGTVVSAICCFTPLLVVALSLMGLSGMVGMLDAILLPVLLMFIILTVIAYWKVKQSGE